MTTKTSLKSGTNPTIKDIAQACGVSEATVSYVINGKRVLRADTRERVSRVMREMNYHPSAVARGLSSKRVHTLGILFGAVDSIEFSTNSYVNGLLQGIMLHAQNTGFDITFFTAKWQNAGVSAPPLRDGRTDGVLAIAPLLHSDMLEGLSALGIPHVAISAATDANAVNIDVDNYAGAKMAAFHLIELGHRRIAYLMGNDDLASFAPRRAGFLAALKEADISPNPQWIQMSHFDGSRAFEQTCTLLREEQRPTAICAGNDHIALGVLEAARSLDIDVPRQLSVIGFDDVPAAMFSTPQLTTIRQPLREIGIRATQMLIERLSSRPEEHITQKELFAPELVIRQSTALPQH
jgi:LacI family transcriptional regulator